MQYAGGILLTPVQTLVTTFIFAPTEQKCKSSPFLDMIFRTNYNREV